MRMSVRVRVRRSLRVRVRVRRSLRVWVRWLCLGVALVRMSKMH